MENYSVLMPSYSVGPDVYQKIPEFCTRYGRTAVVIGGEKAMNAAREKLEKAVEGSEITITDFIWYGKDCTMEGAARLEEMEKVKQADMIFAVGGGKAVDTAKLVSLHLNKPYFSFPTIASNCAASSALSIVYYEDGSFRDFVHFLQPAVHVFIDTDILAHAPKQYLWAGIGDTCAKYYEVSVSAKGEVLEHYKAVGVTLSRMCMEPLTQFGEQAIRDNEQGIASYELEQAALAIIITTGWVSMLVAREHTMDYNGGVAHALFYSLCGLPGFDEDHIHGVVVGFGVLLLLLIDGQEEECEKMKEFNRRIGLPTSFREMGITLAQLESVADRLAKDEDLEHYPYRVTTDMIMQAAEKLK